ncbi:HTH_Tnp_Tc3_2 domain-containing protein [Trichonephila clavipes]|nr:HTH_Tnp_Tc3_2 domain-containing protein [Trichonephila clavipes]
MCWDQWIRKMSLIRRPGSRRPRQTSCREDHHIIRNTRIQPTALSTTIQAQVAHLIGAPVSSRTIRRRLAEEYLGSRSPLRVLTLTPPFVVDPRTGLQWNCTRLSLAMNPDSISAVMTIMFMCENPMENPSILRLLYGDTPLPQLVRWYGMSPTIHGHP